MQSYTLWGYVTSLPHAGKYVWSGFQMVQEPHALTVLKGKDKAVQIRHGIWVICLLEEICNAIQLMLRYQYVFFHCTGGGVIVSYFELLNKCKLSM